MHVAVFYSGFPFYSYQVPECPVTFPAQGNANLNYLVNIPEIAPSGVWKVLFKEKPGSTPS